MKRLENHYRKNLVSISKVSEVLTDHYESYRDYAKLPDSHSISFYFTFNIIIIVFADSDIRSSPEFSSAVQNADIFIGSLIFDYDDVVFVSALLDHVKGPRLIFECATELMSCEFYLS
jgi:hypothetical protein